MMTQPPSGLLDLANRLAEPVGVCVEEVGAARGRQDAPFLLAVLSRGQLADLHRESAGAATGELAAALHRVGALGTCQRFAPNNNGYFPTFLNTTIGMLLGDADRDMLTVLGAQVADLASALHERCVWQLLLGWEKAVYAAFGHALSAAQASTVTPSVVALSAAGSVSGLTTAEVSR